MPNDNQPATSNGSPLTPNPSPSGGEGNQATVTHIPDSALDAIIASYVQAMERGDAPDRARLIAEHPSQAEALAAFFADQDKVQRLTRPATSPLAPQSLLGSYRIVREIGRGGMGIVYEAIHEALKKRVALKLLPVSPLTSGSHLDRFLREAQTAASLHHTNIVPVFDVGQVDGIPFYAMQFIEGRTLDRLFPSPLEGEGLGVKGIRLATDSPTQVTTQQPQDVASAPPHPRPLSLQGRGEKELSPIHGEGRKGHYRHIADLGRQAALGLAHAHSRGVIHRDIKPSNLILDEEGILWITDFGLAKRFTVEDTEVPLTLSGQMLGTPRYMSPEQAAASKNPIDHRTDLYSLGVTLYELLVGKPAFAGQTPPEVVQNILNREAEPLRRHDPQLPRDLETVVLKAMAKRPEDRYATALELADDLGRFLAGELVQARRIGVLGRTWRWAKREPRVAGLVGAVVGSLLLGLVGIGFFTYQISVRNYEIETLLYDGAEGIANRSIEKGEVFTSLLWRNNQLASTTNDAETEYRLRRQIAVCLRYIGVPEYHLVHYDRLLPRYNTINPISPLEIDVSGYTDGSFQNIYASETYGIIRIEIPGDTSDNVLTFNIGTGENTVHSESPSNYKTLRYEDGRLSGWMLKENSSRPASFTSY